ncbi:MAG: MFS transporter, partial [Pseudomonadota bacterium]|nr:MFS transporter [Pseudomonadota bacterium]
IGVTALALIGFFNIIGSYGCGFLGGRYSKKRILSALYFGRALVIAAFIALPVTPLTTCLFASAIGLLWLGTVPLTNGLVAQIFGVQYMSTLFGIVFLGHQLGGFIGAWYGGYVFDVTGSYQTIWLSAIALSVLAGLVCWPIDERGVAPVYREQPA